MENKHRGATGSMPGREGMQPVTDESVEDWVQANGWAESDDSEVRLVAEGSKIWGTAPNAVPLQEEDVRALQGAGKWKPHVMSTWMDWWVSSHPDVPSGTWVASVGTLHTAFRAGQAGGAERIRAEYVLRKGPSHIDRSRASHFWFPVLDMQDGWGMVLADVDKHVLQTWGTVQ